MCSYTEINQKKKKQKGCNERATYVYAILAHVAAVTASDGNKMKARLTCVCCNSCPLRICGK